MLRIPNLENPLRLLTALLLAVVLATVVLVCGSAASSARAADGTNGISGAPSDGTSVDGRSRFSYQVDPGQHLDDFYLLRNTGTTAQTMKVFATDAFDTSTGAFSLLDTKSRPKDSGSWVTFANGKMGIEVPLAPNESKVVSFRLTVPADASPGDHAGGIVISVATPQANIIVDRRVATRLYVRVKGALRAGLTVSSVAATYRNAVNPFSGSTLVRFTVRNNGNVALGATMVVNVKTYLGIAASGLVRSSVSELLPGSTRVVSVEVPGVAQLGYLNPHISLVSTVDPDALNPGPLRSTDRDTAIFAMPWWLLTLLAIAGAIWLFLVVRRKRDAANAQAWIEHMEAEVHRVAAEEQVPETAGVLGNTGPSGAAESN